MYIYRYIQVYSIGVALSQEMHSTSKRYVVDILTHIFSPVRVSQHCLAGYDEVASGGQGNG